MELMEDMIADLDAINSALLMMSQACEYCEYPNSILTKAYGFISESIDDKIQQIKNTIEEIKENNKMISKPTNFDSINENGASRKLPMGGYVCIIRKVTDNAEKNFLEIEYEVAEGEFKGIAVDAYEAWGRWVHTFRVYYTDKAMWRFKRFITRVEQTNPNFTFDWNNVNCLVNKGIGLVIGYRQYYSSRDGSLKEGLDVQDFCTATDVREGNLPKQPEVREPNNPPPAPKMEEDTSSFDDGQLPF